MRNTKPQTDYVLHTTPRSLLCTGSRWASEKGQEGEGKEEGARVEGSVSGRRQVGSMAAVEAGVGW